jgi:outer membrane protein assembly factor BamB
MREPLGARQRSRAICLFLEQSRSGALGTARGANMSEEQNQESALKQEKTAATKDVRPRVWPAAIISFAYLATIGGFAFFDPTSDLHTIASLIAPAVALLLMIIWWIAASRVPWRDRLFGFVLLLVATAAMIFTQKSVLFGALLLVVAMPVVTNGIVALLLVTFKMRWPARRGALFAFVLICACIYCTMRVDSVSSGLQPFVSWRWNPSPSAVSQTLPPPAENKRATMSRFDARADDWPGFRGPERDGRAVGARFSKDWSATPPREVWRIKIGSAWSSFVYFSNYLFTQEQRDENEAVTCYNAETGELVWQNSVKAKYEDNMGLGPRATPTFAHGMLYALGGTGVLQCLDAETGDAIWTRDVLKDTGGKLLEYGFAGSPLVIGDKVFVCSCGGDGKGLTAYSCSKGELIWSAGRGGQCYSSPHFAKLVGMPQILIANDFGVQALYPDTGALLWEDEWRVKRHPRCVQPAILDGDRVMYGATGSDGTRMLHIENGPSGMTAKELWTTKKFRPYFSDGAAHMGFYYGLDCDRLACVDLNTGEVKWQGKFYGGQMLLLPDMDALLILSEKGEVILAPATPAGFSETARFKALTGKTWNHPVIHGNQLFVRNSEEAACFELPK